MNLYYEIESLTIPKHGEEICGDTVRVERSPERTILLLSDGLGSGIRASLSSILTTDMLTRLLSANIPLETALRDVAAAIPTNNSLDAAYATFTALDLSKTNGRCTIFNYGNPLPIFLRKGKSHPLNWHSLAPPSNGISGTEMRIQEGDHCICLSDGVPGAGTNVFLNQGWGIESISKHLERQCAIGSSSARAILRELASQTLKSYGMQPQDDASIAVLHARQGRSTILFTGPPQFRETDMQQAERFMRFEGTRIICGDTTCSVVSLFLGIMPRDVADSASNGLPPLRRLEGVDLVTEGMLTLSRVVEYLERTRGKTDQLPPGNDGARQVAELLLASDEVTLMVGQAENSAYSKLNLPSSSLFRKSIIRQIEHLLMTYGKEVRVGWC